MKSKLVAWIIGITNSEPTEDERFVAKAIEKYPSMRVVFNGCGRFMLTMNREDSLKAYNKNAQKLQQVLKNKT